MAALPLPLGVEHPGLPETAESPRPPGEQKCVWGVNTGASAPSTLKVGAPAPGRRCLPSGLKGAGPE